MDILCKNQKQLQQIIHYKLRNMGNTSVLLFISLFSIFKLGIKYRNINIVVLISIFKYRVLL